MNDIGRVNDIGVAIVGTGFMGWVHVEALRRVGVRVEGICGSTHEKSQTMAKKLGLRRAYASLEEVLDDDKVQSVHVATPNRLHFDLAQRVLERGKHVVCEKPLAMTSSESAELVQTARQHPNVAAAVNYNIRYYPLCLEARHLTRTGRLGDVVHVTGSYVQDWLTYPTDYNWRVVESENGPLRAVADVGTHWLDLVQWITGLRISAVCADLMTVHKTRMRPKGEVETFSSGQTSDCETEPVQVTTDDYGAVLLRFHDGTRGCVHVSQVTPGRKNCVRFEIAGSKQTFAWNSEQPNELWIGHRDTNNETMLRDPAQMSGSDTLAATDYPGGHNEGYPDSFKQCFRSFYDYVRRGDFSQPAPFPTFEDGHREIVLCDAILESDRLRQWIEVT